MLKCEKTMKFVFKILSLFLRSYNLSFIISIYHKFQIFQCASMNTLFLNPVKPKGESDII